MADKLLNGRSTLSRPFAKPFAQGAQLIRLRPIDGGLQSDNTGEFIAKEKASAIRDIYFFNNELRKAPGGVQLGSLFPDPIAWSSVWQRLTGAANFPVVLTTKNLYYYNGSAFVRVDPLDGITGTVNERAQVAFLNDKMYFVSFDYELREWDGINAHTRVASGFAARTMDVFNNRIVLGHTIENGESASQTTRWTQNGIVNFTGTGSGGLDLADRPDYIRTIRKLGPFRGIVYKDDSMHDFRATGDVDFPFQPTEIAPVGIYCGNVCIETPQGHIIPGSDRQIYLYNGSGLQDIGSDIWREFFDNLNISARHKAIGHWDNDEKEAVIIIPTGSAYAAEPSLYYAYNLAKKRWRSGIYTNVTSIGRYKTTIGLSWDEEIGSWDNATDTWNDETGFETAEQTLVGTLDKKVFLLSKSVYDFNGSPLVFERVTGDLVTDTDGGALTLTEVIVGYICDGEADLEVSASIDRGQTFSGLTSVHLGATNKRPNKIYYAHASVIATGDSIRVKIRNANSTQKVRIVSISARVQQTKSSREESLE